MASSTVPPAPGGVRDIRERIEDGVAPLALHPEWEERFPWLLQGTTTRGSPGPPFDLSLFGRGESGRVMERWTALGARTGARRLVHGRQVHGSTVRLPGDGPPGVQVVPATDGHGTDRPGVLLTVSVADCVPVFIVDPERRAVAVLHGGWRGVAAGILEAGFRLLVERLASRPQSLLVHLGPAICGTCYEVGPEVHGALGLPGVGGPAPVDLRAVLARRAVAAGTPPGNVSRSTWCTRCGDGPFFSHRAGDRERQVGFVGMRE